MEKKNWIWGLIEGIVALGFGIFMLVSSESASNLIGLAAGVFLVVSGGVEAFARRGRISDTGFIRGLVGLVGGVAMLVMVFTNFVSTFTAYNILAVFLIVYGGIGLFNDFFARGGKEFAWGPVLLDAILVVWGVLIFLSRTRDFSLLTVSGWILVVLGIIFGVWAILVVRPRGATSSS